MATSPIWALHVFHVVKLSTTSYIEKYQAVSWTYIMCIIIDLLHEVLKQEIKLR